MNDYVNNSGISCDGVWATDADYMAKANLLSCDIVTYTNVGDSVGDVSRTLQSAVNTERALYLQNKHDHFDVVISD